MISQDLIRNFCIIAHIDHGKSTLADRMLEMTHTVAAREIKPQMLDTMDLERERGITIKLQPVRMGYKEYILNLIDTPGHVDFSYEVSRSLAAVEGAVLVVDATKGIQAQTLANLHYAQLAAITIIPVINKIDLPNARVPEVTGELGELLNIDKNDIILCSAKTGEGVAEILNRIISDIPSPTGDRAGNLRALIFDSIYDSYRGVVAYVRIVDGHIKKGDRIRFLATGKTAEAAEVGEFGKEFILTGFQRGAGPPATQASLLALRAGEIGYVVTGEKNIQNVRVGDTITPDSPEAVSPISGFKIPQPMVFASFFLQGGEPNHLRMALEKLKLNDSSLGFEPENSASFGHGFKCGFLGMLHLEIVKERLEREYNLNIIVTQPSVQYKIEQIGPQTQYQEPWVNLELITPKTYVGPVMELASNERAIYQDTKYFGEQAVIKYEAPLSEIIVDFHDKLKSVSQGYASQNYELIGWRPGDLVCLDIIIAGKEIEEFQRIVPRSWAQTQAKNLALKLKDLIPRQMFEVSVQIADHGKILARENISAMKKDVIAKLYGGDVTRKNKLLKKQAAGKRKMKMIGKVQIPDKVFMEILKS